MIDDTAAQAASDLIWEAWQAGARIGSLPEALRPATRAEGYAIQARLEARSARPLFGWKIAATSKAGQAHIGVGGPLAGRILAEMVVPEGSALPLSDNAMRVAEPEFVFRMGTDLPPRAEAYTQDEILDEVARLVDAGKLRATGTQNYGTINAANLKRAHALIESNKSRGKIVLEGW